VAAEPADVLLHPAQRCLLVHQPVVAGRAAGVRRQGGVRQEAERAEPVVDRDGRRAVCRELGGVVVLAGPDGAPPPWLHTSTGWPPPYNLRGSGVYTLRYRQSSLARAYRTAGTSARTRSRRGHPSTPQGAPGDAIATDRSAPRRRAARGR